MHVVTYWHAGLTGGQCVHLSSEVLGRKDQSLGMWEWVHSPPLGPGGIAANDKLPKQRGPNTHEGVFVQPQPGRDTAPCGWNAEPRPSFRASPRRSARRQHGEFRLIFKGGMAPRGVPWLRSIKRWDLFSKWFLIIMTLRGHHCQELAWTQEFWATACHSH